jgi:hypothetical protein
MQLPTIVTVGEAAHQDASACMSYGGLVDRDTAAAEDVVLWTDPVTIASIARRRAIELRQGRWQSDVA